MGAPDIVASYRLNYHAISRDMPALTRWLRETRCDPCVARNVEIRPGIEIIRRLQGGDVRRKWLGPLGQGV